MPVPSRREDLPYRQITVANPPPRKKVRGVVRIWPTPKPARAPEPPPGDVIG